MWEGQDCAVLASGQSMCREVVETVRRSRVRVIVINNTHELARWADMLYAADATWWQQYHAKTAGFLGFKVAAEETPFTDVLRVVPSGKEGFDPDPGAIRTGGNGGYAAIHIAAHAGCRRILLCGFDMHGKHWHPRHEYPLRDAGQGIFKRWIARFETLAPELAKRGIEVLNCTPESALSCFPMAKLEDAIAPRAVAA